MSKLIFTTGYNDLGQQTIKFKPRGGKFRIQGEGSEMNDKRNMMSASELEDLQDRNDDAFLDVRAGTTLRDMTEEYETHTVINETEDDIMEKHDIGDTSEVQTRRMKANTDSKKLKRLNTEDIKSSTMSWDGSEKKKKKEKKALEKWEVNRKQTELLGKLQENLKKTEEKGDVEDDSTKKVREEQSKIIDKLQVEAVALGSKIQTRSYANDNVKQQKARINALANTIKNLKMSKSVVGMNDMIGKLKTVNESNERKRVPKHRGKGN